MKVQKFLGLLSVLCVLICICIYLPQNWERKSPPTDDLPDNNLIGNIPDITKTTENGITYSCKAGEFELQGTPTKGPWYKVIAGSNDALPDGIIPGKKYYVKFEQSLPAQKVQIRFVDGDDNLLFYTYNSATFVIPDIDAMKIRIQVPTGQKIEPVRVSPCIILADEDMEEKNFSSPLLTIIDDDGDIHYYTDLFPLAKEKHVPIATAVTIKRIGSASRWMNWEQIEEVYGEGMEVLNHTYSHPKPADLEGISQNELIEKLTMSLNQMQQHNIMTSDIVVYSSSTGDMENIQSAAEHVFKAGIRVGYNHPNTSDTDRYALERYRIDYSYEYDIVKIQKLLDELKEHGGWMIWMIHSSAGDWGEEHLKTVSEAIDYALSIDIPIVTTHYGLKKYYGIE